MRVGGRNSKSFLQGLKSLCGELKKDALAGFFWAPVA